jgi:hypothetical protein
VYLIPIFDREEVKMEKLPPNTKELQIVQNSMVRAILGLKQADHVTMSEVRNKIRMFSVNQMAVYHTVMEAYNITNKSASEQLQKKMNKHKHIGPKLYNMIPKKIKEAKTTDDFKTQLKGWIWEKIH